MPRVCRDPASISVWLCVWQRWVNDWQLSTEPHTQGTFRSFLQLKCRCTHIHPSVCAQPDYVRQHRIAHLLKILKVIQKLKCFSLAQGVTTHKYTHTDAWSTEELVYMYTFQTVVSKDDLVFALSLAGHGLTLVNYTVLLKTLLSHFHTLTHTWGHKQHSEAVQMWYVEDSHGNRQNSRRSAFRAKPSER